MSRRLTAAAAIVLASVFSFPAHARPQCHTPAEVGAVQFRQLQIEFMVASLKCDGTGYDFRGHYAAYMHKAGPSLSDNARQIKAMLARHGKGNIDRYFTGMSNDAQIRSASVADYCGAQAQVLEKAAAMSAQQLHTFAAETVSSPYEVNSCPVKEASAQPTKKSAIKKVAHKKTGSES